jgi:antitoxin ParD1/3/4
MQRNTSVILGSHFSEFINEKVTKGRFETISEAVRAGLKLLEVEETKLDLLRIKLAEGEKQILIGEGKEGDAFMKKLIS